MIEYRIMPFLKEGVDKLANAVKVTLGPKGKNVVLFNDNKAFITKDGVSVAKKVSDLDTRINVGIQIAREAALKTADEAGDGTTTSTVLAQKIFENAYNYFSNPFVRKPSVFTIKSQMEEALSLIVSMIKEQSEIININYNKLKYIASTSANNDDSIGDLVATAFVFADKEGLVTFQESPTNSTYIDFINGTQIDEGVYSRDFITNNKNLETVYENPYICVFNGNVSSINTVSALIRKSVEDRRPIVIVAPNFEDSAIRSFLVNNYQGTTRILPIKIVGYSANKTEVLQDIAAATNSTIINPSNIKDLKITEYLGTVDKIISTSTKTIFIRANNDFEKLNLRKEELKSQLDYAIKNNPEAVEFARKRLAKFIGKVAVINIGGNTEVEIKEKYDRIEDAVCATRSAIEEGISAGGGNTLLRIQKDILNTFNGKLPAGFKIVVDSLSAPFEQLCKNAELDYTKIKKNITSEIGYNFATDSYENLLDTGVIDATKVLRVALTNAVSAISLLITTECIVKDDLYREGRVPFES